MAKIKNSQHNYLFFFLTTPAGTHVKRVLAVGNYLGSFKSAELTGISDYKPLHVHLFTFDLLKSAQNHLKLPFSY